MKTKKRTQILKHSMAIMLILSSQLIHAKNADKEFTPEERILMLRALNDVVMPSYICTPKITHLSDLNVDVFSAVNHLYGPYKILNRTFKNVTPNQVIVQLKEKFFSLEVNESDNSDADLVELKVYALTPEAKVLKAQFNQVFVNNLHDPIEALATALNTDIHQFTDISLAKGCE